MAKTVISGVNGSITVGTVTTVAETIKFDKYQLTLGQRIMNVTGFDSLGYEQNIAGLKYGRGSATGHFYTGNGTAGPGGQLLTQNPLPVTFYISSNTSALCTESFYNTGDATTGILVDNVQFSVDVNGETRGTFDFVTSGVCVEAWA
jgi:hypothetical protein